MTNIDGLYLSEIETSQKTLTKLSKKIISILGFCFILDKSHKIWLETINDRSHSIRQMHPSNESSRDTKLIEFLLEQLTLVVMNDFMYPKLCHHLLICLQNIGDSIEYNPESNLIKPQILDYLIYLNTRLGFPYMLNKQEFLDPIVRLKNNYQRLNKSLKEIFKDQFQMDDFLYCNMLLNN